MLECDFLFFFGGGGLLTKLRVSMVPVTFVSLVSVSFYMLLKRLGVTLTRLMQRRCSVSQSSSRVTGNTFVCQTDVQTYLRLFCFAFVARGAQSVLKSDRRAGPGAGR